MLLVAMILVWAMFANPCRASEVPAAEVPTTDVSAEEGPTTAPFTFRGIVHIDRPDVKTLYSPCRNMVVAWMCQEGQQVAKGDPIIVFDTSELQTDAVLKQYKLKEAEVRLIHNNLELTSELKQLKEEQGELESKLTVIRASLAKARRVDRDLVGLLWAEHERSQQRLNEQNRVQQFQQELLKLGEISIDDLLTVEMTTAKIASELDLSELEWKQQKDRIDTLEVLRLELAERDLLMQLGAAPSSEQGENDSGGESGSGSAGSTDVESIKGGITRRIVALERKIEQQRTKNQSALDRASKEYHEAVRDAYDHTPLTFVEIISEGSDQPVRRISFQPTAMCPPEGFAVDDGSIFSAERGHGWARDLRGAVHQREVNEPRDAGVIVIREKSTWRCALPDGTYQLRLGVGDKVDWHGAVVRHGVQTLFASSHLKQHEVVEQNVQVDGGALELIFGNTKNKILPAPDEGSANCQRWLYVGRKLRGNHWPVAYFTDPKHYKITALIHQDTVGLLKAAEKPEQEEENPEPAESDLENQSEESQSTEGQTTDGTQTGASDGAPLDKSAVSPSGAEQETDPNPIQPMVKDGSAADSDTSESDKTKTASLRIAAARQRVATSKVTITTASGVELNGIVSSIGTQPVAITRSKPMWYWGGEKRGKDLIAREVMIAVDGETASQLRLGENVLCTARIKLGSDMIALPAHMVAEGKFRNVVVRAEDGVEQEVEGFRAGQSFVVTDTWDGEQSLAEPVHVVVDRDKQRRTFVGEVVAGRRQQVGIGRYWGRIKEMVEEGSQVAKGQEIVTLYNPKLDANKEKIKDAKVQAHQDYLVAIEDRRVESLQAQLEHHERVVAEHEARISLATIRRQEPVPLATAASAHQQAVLKAQLQADRLETLQTLAASSGEVEAARIRAEKAGLAARRSHIEQITALRSMDWLKLNEANQTWLDAVDALSLRESALQVLRKQEQVARMGAERKLQQALEGNWRQRVFDQIKKVKSPADGRIFYLTWWDDHSDSRSKIKKDFAVWSGVPIADILDMQQLGIEAELPERLYRQISLETKAVVGFDQFPGVEVEANIERIGKSFYIPKDLYDTNHGKQSVSIRRVFTVKLLFFPPSELAEYLTPGTKGYVYLR